MMYWEMKHPRFYVLVLLVQMLRIKHLDTWLALIIQLKLIMGSGFKHSYLDEVFAYAYRVMLCGRDCFFFILLINCQLLCVWICCLYCFYEKHIVTFCLIMEKLCWLIVFDFLLFSCCAFQVWWRNSCSEFLPSWPCHILFLLGLGRSSVVLHCSCCLAAIWMDREIHAKRKH